MNNYTRFAASLLALAQITAGMELAYESRPLNPYALAQTSDDFPEFKFVDALADMQKAKAYDWESIQGEC